jgi:hypothetical protein
MRFPSIERVRISLFSLAKIYQYVHIANTTRYDASLEPDNSSHEIEKNFSSLPEPLHSDNLSGSELFLPRSGLVRENIK